MAYVIIVHLLYLLTSILYFDIIRGYYTLWVQLNLLEFMSKIREMLLKSSTFLHALMEILILHFCVIINIIFGIIKAKLLYFLNRLELQIDFDKFLLSVELASLELLLSELQSDLLKYLSISKLVNQFLKPLVRLTEDNKKLMELINKVNSAKKNINKLDHKFSYQNHRISKTLKLLSSIKLERSIKSSRDKNPELVMNLKINLGKLNKHLSYIINLVSVDPLIIKVHDKTHKRIIASIKKGNGSKDNGIQNVQESINKLLDQADEEVSKEIMSIVKQLLKVETINLGKLYKLMAELQLKYFEIIIRGHLLVCSMEFYIQVTRNVSELFGLMKFDCSKVSEFLGKCSQVEQNGQSVCSKIDDCIKKLATLCTGCKSCIFRKQPIDLFIKLIGIITFLKFYVDLLMREILIFKNIINNLIAMAVSSVFIEFIQSQILGITNVQDAIDKLRECHWYLQAFYTIQAENTSVIIGLSSKLMFSQYIHGYYDVLVINLYWINRLIWIIECYIHHLIVFRHVSKDLNSLTKHIGGQVKIITNIYKVISSLATISNKLKSIDKSIQQLNDIQDNIDITKWKENQSKIRDQIKNLNSYINDINSELSLIKESVKSNISSRNRLIWVYYCISILMFEVYVSILYTNHKYRLGISIQSPYFRGIIMSVLGPCNKQIMFILMYLLVMWMNIYKLIKIVQNMIGLMIAKLAYLYGLTSKLKSNIEEIDKGVVDVECAIEGVARNFIRCSVLSGIESNRVNVINSSSHNINIIKVFKLL